MASIYRVDFLDRTTGTKYAEVIDYEEGAINCKVNSPGMLTLTLKKDHAVFEDLGDYDFVEVYRKDPEKGIDWALEFGGIFVYINIAEPSEDVPYANLIAFDYLIYLNWRIIAYLAETTNRSKFSNAKAETISKTLVDYNLGPNATDSARKLSGGSLTGFTIDTDQNRGTSLTISCAFRNLLEVLQEIAVKGGGDFNIIRTGANLKFYWYPGQLGTDRRDTLIFAKERGNIQNPEYEKSRIDERTIVLAGGAGEAQDRYTTTFTGDTYSSANHKEFFMDARDLTSDDSAELGDRADAKLDEYKLEETTTLEIVQIEGCLYGIDYFLGDLGKVVNPITGITDDCKIVEVTQVFEQDGGQSIEVGVEKYV